MPLQQRVIEPVNVSRSTLPLPPGDIKPLIKSIAAATGQGLAANAAAATNINIVNELECVTNGTLANLIRQLSTLARQAEELLNGVFEDSSKLLNRTNNIRRRMDALTLKVDSLNQLSDAPIILRDPTNQIESFRSDMSYEQQVLSDQKMPSSIAELYNICDKPPPLSKLDPYRDDGKSGLKFYTDPTYFFELWKKDMVKSTNQQQQIQQQQQLVRQQQQQQHHQLAQQQQQPQHVMNQSHQHQQQIHMQHQQLLQQQAQQQQQLLMQQHLQQQQNVIHQQNNQHLNQTQTHPQPPVQLQQSQQQMQLQSQQQQQQQQLLQQQQSQQHYELVQKQQYAAAAQAATNNHHAPPMEVEPPPPPPPPPALSPLPPPPPPAPPAPPPMSQVPANPPAVLQVPTAAQLQQKQQQLRKTVPVQRDPRSDLLAAIKQGITLRRVEDSKRRVEAEKQQSMGNDVASILARRVAMQVSDSDDNGDDDDEDNDWNDSSKYN